MSTADGPDRRRLILDAALRVVVEEGADAVRMADVAEAAGVSLGSIQHHFRHRDGLLAEVFRYESERIAATWRGVVGSDDPPLERLVEYVWLCTPAGSASAATSFRGWGFWLDFWATARREPQTRAEVAPIYQSFALPFQTALADGISNGEFTLRGTVRDVADRMIAMIDGTALRTLLGALEERQMLPLLIDGLTVELGLDDDQAREAHRIAARLSERQGAGTAVAAGRASSGASRSGA
jgi:AcrR family transcriptional regulator